MKSVSFSTHTVYHLLILKTGSTRDTASRSWTTMPMIPHRTCLISGGMNNDLPGFIKARERPHREKDRLKNTQRERQKWKKTQEQHSRRERTQNKRGRESQTQRDRVINQRTKNERTKKQENYREQKNPGTRRQTEKKNRSDV